VYALFRYPGGASAQLSVNWSDESHRKMSTAITVWGTKGRLTADRQECQIYLREPHEALPGAPKGWSVRYTTDLTQEVWYYLRGEEYSAQVDYFVQSIKLGRLDGENSFRSALQTDRLVAQLLETESGAATQRAAENAAIPGRRGGLWSRLVGG
jgi:predicted dehydrogenase